MCSLHCLGMNILSFIVFFELSKTTGALEPCRTRNPLWPGLRLCGASCKYGEYMQTPRSMTCKPVSCMIGLLRICRITKYRCRHLIHCFLQACSIKFQHSYCLQSLCQSDINVLWTYYPKGWDLVLTSQALDETHSAAQREALHSEERRWVFRTDES